MGRQSRVWGSLGAWRTQSPQREHSPQSLSMPTPCHLTPSSSWGCLEASCRDEVPPTLVPAQQPLRGPRALLALCLKPGSLKSRWANFLLQLDTNSSRAVGTRSTTAVGGPPSPSRPPSSFSISTEKPHLVAFRERG